MQPAARRPRIAELVRFSAGWLAVVAVVFATSSAAGAGAPQANAERAPWAGLEYRHVGPIGNRISAVVGVPGDLNTYYIGAASGGVWKSTDGGIRFVPVFDDQEVQSIGSLAIAPSDPSVVWAGTGETFIRSNVVVGNGIYRSTDGGTSWQHRGLDESGRIGRIVVHPTNPDIVYAAALGHLYGPQTTRGVYKTVDGGETWRRVLFTNDDSGAVDIVMDPSNPRILYAATWQMQIWTWGRESGGPGSGIHRSTDGGETWVQLTEGGAARDRDTAASDGNRGTVRGAAGVLETASGSLGRGLPGGPLGKIGLAISADRPERIYALIETSAFTEFAPIRDHGVLWRSDDRGATWELVNSNHALTQRPLYYTRATVAPDDHNEIHFMAVSHTRSLDGGRSVERVSGSGGDNHDMWIDPLMPQRMIIGHDGGVAISTDRGRSWAHPPLSVAQMYHVATDDRIPYFLYGNRQDGPSYRGPSNSLSGGRIATTLWHSVGGCESGWAIPDTSNEIVWSGCFEGILDRYDLRTGHAQNVSVWPDNPEGWAAGDLRDRFQWTFPIHISPHDDAVVYVGSQRVHRTDDGGMSWQPISPDLTTNDKELQQKTGGLTPDDSSPTYAAVLFAIAESPRQAGLIWAGSNDGLIHVSRNGGQDWQRVSDAMPDLPPLGTVSSIEPSRHDDATAYVAIDTHQVNSSLPYLYRTRDYGTSWERIVDGIPDGPLSYTHVVREDPVRPGLLYAGTGNGLYVSLDDGDSWQSLQNNLPRAPVHWIEIQEHFNDLVVATYGRGFWILDDITPLQQLDVGAYDSESHLFEPRPAYRFLSKQSPTTGRDDYAAGSNPDYGATIHYWLGADDLGKAVTVEILDADGSTLRALRGTSDTTGIQRVVWNLRMEATPTPRMRTQPLEHEHVEVNDAGWRPPGEFSRIAPLVVPGTYALRVTVGDRVHEASLEVRKDPNSAGTVAQIEEQTDFVLALRDDLVEVVELIDEIEWLRSDVDRVQARLERPDSDIATALQSLDDALLELETELIEPRLTGGLAGQDTLRWPRQLFAKLGSLAGYVGGTDFPPTAQQREVYEGYRSALAQHIERMNQLREESRRVNDILAVEGLGALGVRGGR